jgi:hypothetical protein
MLSAKTIRMIYGGVVEMLGEKYGFNVEEGMNLMLEGVGRGVVRCAEKKNKCKKVALPFISVDLSRCKGCKMNRGLYTQCENKCEDLCNECTKECENNNGILPYGRIEERAAAGNEFKDSKGRSPTPYIKVLEKLKITVDEAKSYANSIGIELPEEVFEMPAKKVKEIRGRPKKASKSVEVDSSENLFEGLVQISLSETVSDNEISESSSESAKESEKEAQKLAKEVEKLAKKEALEAEKLAKKEALEAEKLAKKEALEAEKLAKKEALEAEKLAKKEALEAEKLAKKEALEAEKLEKLKKKEALEAEKLEKLKKKEALEAEKEAKKAKKETKKAKKGTKKGNVTPCVSDSEEEEEEEQEEVSCKKFEFNGKTYLKTEKNVLYDYETQDEIGVWNEKEQKIEYSELSEDEEEE